MTGNYDEINKKIKEGDIDTIIMALKSKKQSLKMITLKSVVDHNYSDGVIRELIIDQEKDKRRMLSFPFTVSDWAEAAMDILGIKKYTGSDQFVKKLIDCRMKFEEE